MDCAIRPAQSVLKAEVMDAMKMSPGWWLVVMTGAVEGCCADVLSINNGKEIIWSRRVKILR